MPEVVLDFTEYYGDGDRRRRKRRKYLIGAEKTQIRHKLQQVGFTNHEIDLWIKEEIPLRSRVAQNLIYARRLIMKDFMDKGANFREARQLAVQDRIDSTKGEHSRMSKEEADDYLWGILYVIGDPRDRRLTGPKPAWMKKATVKVS